MKNLSVVSCSKESHVFLLETACENHLFDFWIYIKEFKTVLTKENSQGNYCHHPHMQGILASTRDTFLGQNCKQCPVLVTSQTQTVERKCTNQTALARTNQRNKQNFVWAPGGKSNRGTRWEGLLEGNVLSSCPPWQSRPD